MSAPEFQSKAGVYQLTWHDENIQIRVDRMRTDKAGVYGEILIQTTAPGMHPHIHGPVQFNFTATTTRSTLVKHLSNIRDFTDILEQTCYMVVEAHRRGVPAINMASHEMPERVGMRVAPLLQEKTPTIFFGEGDSLKSYLATYIAVLTRLGTPGAGLTPEPGSILFCDYEEDSDTFWERLDMITTGLDVSIPDGIYWRKMVEPLSAEFPALNHEVMEHNIEMVIIDSAAPAALEPEKAEMTIAYFKALRALGVTTLTIAHDTKAARGNGVYPFGSVFWRNLARSLFYVKADRNQDDVAISLKHTKANNGRRLSPMGFRFAFQEDRVLISSAKAADYEELAGDVPLRERIKSVLLGGMTTVEVLAEQIDASEASIRTTLNRNKETFLKYGNSWGVLRRD